MTSFNLNEITLGQIKELRNLFNSADVIKEDCPFEIGENYLIRTVTFTLTGKIKSKTNQFLVLSDADWIADTNRFHDALKDSDKFNEVEPFINDCIVSKGSIVDATKIVKLYRKQK